jgi:hypothetical protein
MSVKKTDKAKKEITTPIVHIIVKPQREAKKPDYGKIAAWVAVVSVILMIIFGTLSYFLPLPKSKDPLKIQVDNIKPANNYIDCRLNNTVTLSFSLYYISGEREKGSYPYYILLASNNSCYNGTFFRNQTRNYLCWNDYSTGQRVKNCQSKFEPLWYEPTDVLSYLNNETETFYDHIINLNRSCEIMEKIKLCAYNDNSCSETATIKLNYIPCSES